jgi:hypothetical protein
MVVLPPPQSTTCAARGSTRLALRLIHKMRETVDRTIVAVVSLFLLFLLFLYEIISRRYRRSPRKSWAASGSAIGKTAESFAVFLLFPLFS